MRNYFILYVLLMVVFSACTNDDGGVLGKVNIRVRNIDKAKFDSVTIGGLAFSNIKSGKTTKYKVYESETPPSGIEVISKGESRLVIIDFGADAKIENGFYTYEVESNANYQLVEE